MKEWCRFAVCWWHTFNGGMGRDPFSYDKTHVRSWDKDDSLETFKERVHAAFEFFQKLGIEYYCFHDTHVAPKAEGNWHQAALVHPEHVLPYQIQRWRVHK